MPAHLSRRCNVQGHRMGYSTVRINKPLVEGSSLFLLPLVVSFISSWSFNHHLASHYIELVVATRYSKDLSPGILSRGQVFLLPRLSGHQNSSTTSSRFSRYLFWTLSLSLDLTPSTLPPCAENCWKSALHHPNILVFEQKLNAYLCRVVCFFYLRRHCLPIA